MPIYEFTCRKCQAQFETLVALGKEKDESCPHCGSGSLDKNVSSFGIGGGSTKLSSNSSCQTCSATSCSTCK